MEEIEILVSSDPDYSELTAEIFYRGKFIALINQDNGVDQLIVEFPKQGIDESTVSREIDLGILEQAFVLAREKLAD